MNQYKEDIEKKTHRIGELVGNCGAELIQGKCGEVLTKVQFNGRKKIGERCAGIEG